MAPVGVKGLKSTEFYELEYILITSDITESLSHKLLLVTDR